MAGHGEDRSDAGYKGEPTTWATYAMALHKG